MLVVQSGKAAVPPPLFTECRAWLSQIKKLWKDIGKAHGWKHPSAPSGKWLWREKTTEAVLAFLGSTRVGYINVRRKVPEAVLAFLGSTRVGYTSVRRKVPEEAAEAEDTSGSSSG